MQRKCRESQSVLKTTRVTEKRCKCANKLKQGVQQHAEQELIGKRPRIKDDGIGIRSTLQFHCKDSGVLLENSSSTEQPLEQTIHRLAPKCSPYNSRPPFAKSKVPQKELQTEKPEMHEDYEYVKSLEKEVDELESEKADFSNIYDLLLEEVNHTTSVSRPQLKCYQVKDKVVPNNSQVKFKKKEVEDHHRISSISKKTKSVTACNDSSNSRTSNVNVVCAECRKCVFNSNHDACVSRYLNDVNARTKKPNVVPISASKPKRKMNKSVATPHKKIVASDTTIQKSKSYYKELYENTNQEWKWWIAKTCPSGYTWTQKPLRTKKIWMPKIRKDDVSTSISPTIDIVSRITNVLKISNSLGSNLSNVPSSSNSLADCITHPIHCLVPQRTKASDYDNSDPRAPKTKWLFYSREDIYAQQGTECIVINPFCTRVQEIGESSSRNIDNTDVHSFQPQSHDYRWTRDHPLEQVRGNPTMPVQTRRQLATDPEMCMFALTVSIVEPKNIKEAMADSAWIRSNAG
ncbi:hypothetical protein Tco_0312253 [Tanacetum coccineum]